MRLKYHMTLSEREGGWRVADVGGDHPLLKAALPDGAINLHRADRLTQRDDP